MKRWHCSHLCELQSAQVSGGNPHLAYTCISWGAGPHPESQVGHVPWQGFRLRGNIAGQQGLGLTQLGCAGTLALHTDGPAGRMDGPMPGVPEGH